MALCEPYPAKSPRITWIKDAEIIRNAVFFWENLRESLKGYSATVTYGKKFNNEYIINSGVEKLCDIILTYPFLIFETENQSI